MRLKGKWLDDFMKKDEHGKAALRMSLRDDDLNYPTHINN